ADRRLAAQPAELDLLAGEQRRAVDDAPFEGAHDDVELLDGVEAGSHLERSARVLTAGPGAAGQLGEAGERLVEALLCEPGTGVADPADDRADELQTAVCLVVGVVAAVHHLAP